MNNVGITLPINLVPPDNFPKSVVVGENKIVFFYGNIAHIELKTYLPNEDEEDQRIEHTLEISFTNKGYMQIHDYRDIAIFLSQFPKEMFEKATNLHDFYCSFVYPIR